MAASTLTKVKPIGGAKNGKERTITISKTPRHIELSSDPVPKKNRKIAKPTKLRSTITPGTVLILLAGRFRGKRVVFLKQLESGLLLVTGPFKVNGVPLKRVSQSFVIATSTKIDLGKMKLSEKLTDGLFKREKKAAAKEFFADSEEKKQISAERKALQADIDSQLLPIVKATAHLKAYLGSFFTLKKGQAPHQMKF